MGHSPFGKTLTDIQTFRRRRLAQRLEGPFLPDLIQ
jgi:hypothetical protein